MIEWIAVVSILLLAYYLYIPVPKEATEPWKSRFTASLGKVQGDLMFLFAFIFKEKIHVVQRSFFERLMAFFLLFQPKIDGIEEKLDNFDGVTVRIFRPSGTDKQLPGIVYIHGGGWIIFSTRIYSYFTKEMAKKANAVVISIEYSLAPENVFPAGFNDCLNATKYFLKNARQFDIIPDKIGIAGDSAGGNLAMAVALKLSTEPVEGLPRLAFEVLIYPCLQAFDFNLGSYKNNNTDRNTICPTTRNVMIMLNNCYAFGDYTNFMAFSQNTHIKAEMKKKYRNRVDPRLLPSPYRTEPRDDDETDNIKLAKKISEIIFNPYFSPIMASDEQLIQLPPTYLITCEYDGLRDENLILYERMKRMQHPVEHLHLSGSEHGVLLWPYYEEYKKSVNKIAYYVQKITE